MIDNPIRVLLVDDEKELVSHLVKRLKQRGYEVEGVSSGEAALEAAERQHFDVAVVDVKMPGLDGVETLKELKSLQSSLQVIMLTGYGSLSNAFESGKHDAYSFLTKPYDFDKLLGEIQRAARDLRASLQSEYRRELQEVMSSNLTPREIMIETERLRKKYDM